ncbi:MAG: glutathione S-transferase family protein [Pseudomonadota bacterium]
MAITLVQYKRGYGVANLSPFCMKAEILLKLSGQDYTVEVENDPRKTPKGKLPMIRDGAQVIADSTFIERHLAQTYDVDFYAGLSAEQKAYAHAIGRMCEERFYWVLLYTRWIEPENWPKISQFWFGDMPPIIRNIIPKVALKEVRGNLTAQGVGRHSREDIYALGEQDIAALAGALGDKDFFFGTAPCGTDAVTYPFIEGVLMEALPSPLLEVAKSFPALAAYRDRCRALWFAEL